MPAAHSAISTGVVVTLLLLSTVVSITLGGIAWSRINSLHLPFPASLGAISTLYPLLPFTAALIANVLASQYRHRENRDTPKHRITASTNTSDENGRHSTSVTATNNTIASSQRSKPSFFPLVSPITSFVFDQLLTLLPVVLATLAATYIAPSDNYCHLEQAWQSYYHLKDVSSIRSIQDQLQCCGLRSTKDRAWPFKDKNHGDDACERTTGYTHSCLGPWSDQERRVAILVFVAGVFGWGIKMGVINFVQGRFLRFVNPRTRRHVWFQEGDDDGNGDCGDISGPRLLPFTDSDNGNTESEEAVSGNDATIIESPLLNPDARDLTSPEGRDLTGGSPWRENP